MIMKRSTTQTHFKILLTIIITHIFFTVISAIANATMNELSDHDLDQISAESGIAFGFKNIQIFNVIDSFTYCATDGGYINFHPIVLHGANSDTTYNLNYDFGTITDSGIVYFDLSTCQIADEEDWSGSPVSPIYKSMGAVRVPSWEQDLIYTIGHFTFSDGIQAYDLLQLDIGPIRTPSYQYYFAPHPGSGIDFEYDFEMHIDDLSWRYKYPNERLTISDLHIGHSFDYGSLSDKPEDPSTWKTEIGEFKIGDMFGDLTTGAEVHSNPAQIGAGLLNAENNLYNASAGFYLPLEGSIRFEGVDFAGTNFGPGAIDNIKAYRLQVFLIP
jgi:hypothetical protein